MNFQEVREWANHLRAIPLEEVLLLAGAIRDRSDRAKWHTDQGVLSVTGAKFMNWNRSVGGGGAIDLAMHLGGLRFMEALNWLSRNFPAHDRSDLSQVSPRSLLLPRRDDQKLPAVRRYLFERRRLPPALVEPLIAGGSVYADTRGNAVFLLLGERDAPVGAEIRGTTGTPWRGMAAGSRKDLGYFSITVPEPTAIILCESAIDAVSCLALNDRTLCISTAGARPNPIWLESLLQIGKPVRCGFDADLTGDEMARAMIGIHPSITRLRPSLHDWNDVLKARS
jgi:hypothetical protein